MNSILHNEVAEFAYTKLVGLNPDREFRSLARSFPSMLQINGLGAAAAFLFSKKKGKEIAEMNSYNKMYTLITCWIANKFGKLKNDDLTEHILSLDSSNYRVYTNEVMNLCLWIKRFAEGMVDGDE